MISILHCKRGALIGTQSHGAYPQRVAQVARTWCDKTLHGGVNSTAHLARIHTRKNFSCVWLKCFIFLQCSLQ